MKKIILTVSIMVLSTMAYGYREADREAYERIGKTLPKDCSYLARQLGFGCAGHNMRLPDLTYEDRPIPIHGGVAPKTVPKQILDKFKDSFNGTSKDKDK